MKTIYFGGGTPSLFSVKKIAEILSLFPKEPDAELTLEIDPGTFTKESLEGYKAIGFNRLSMGV